MARYGFVIDLKRCYGCYSCQVSCKAANHTPKGIDWAWCVPSETGTFPSALRQMIPMVCQQCGEPPEARGVLDCDGWSYQASFHLKRCRAANGARSKTSQRAVRLALRKIKRPPSSSDQGWTGRRETGRGAQHRFLLPQLYDL